MKSPRNWSPWTRYFSFFLAAGLLLAQLGCSVQGQISDLTEKLDVSTASPTTGIISGSQQNMSVSGYNVSVSVGHFSGGEIQQSVGGYTVYTTVQGNLISQ
jgi:hypothetical protein